MQHVGGTEGAVCVCVSVYYKSILHLIHVVLFTLYNSNCLLLAQTEQRSCTYATEQRETEKHWGGYFSLTVHVRER